MQGRLRPARPLARAVAFALLVPLAPFASAAERHGPSCLVPTVGSPACTAGTGSAPGSAVAANGPGLHVGNPIEVASGNKYQREIDYLGFGTGLAFTRHYNSLLADEDESLGPGWRHTYQVSLAGIREGGLRLRQSDGRTLDFAPVPGTSSPAVHLGATPADGLVTHEGERSSWYLPDGRRLDFRGPWLERLDFGDARGALELRYRRDGRVASVVDRLGRALEFRYVARSEALPTWNDAAARYRPPGALEAVLLPDGRELRFEYAADRTLESAVRADGDRVDYGYTDIDWLPPLLASRRVTPAGADAGTAVRTRWRYDDDGLAIGVDGAVGLDVERVPHGPDGGGTATVRWRDGRTEAVAWSADGRIVGGDAPPPPPAPVDAGANDGSAPAPLDAIADAALATLRPAPDGDGATLLATLPLEGRDAPLWMRADGYGNLDLLRLGKTDLQRLLGRAGAGPLASCGTAPLDGSAVAARLAALADGAEPCAGDALATFALESALERRQRYRPRVRASRPAPERHGSTDAPTAFNPGVRFPTIPQVRQGPEPSACDVPSGKDCAALVEDHEMALLSECVYESGTCASDWRAVDPAEIGLEDTDFHDAGFDAVLYHDAATGRYTLTFRGTDGVGDDWKGANIPQGQGKQTRQYDLAYDLAFSVTEALPPGADLSFAGHSLGGGLATFAALRMQGQATVFNAAALHPATAARVGLEQEYADADQYIDLVTIHDDPVTAVARTANNNGLFGAKFTPGRHTVLANPTEAWTDRNVGTRPYHVPLARHSMAAVIEQLEIILDKHCGGMP